MDLQKRYPNIRCHLYSGNADDVMERLDRGLLDYCLLVMPVDLAKYNHLALPAKETWGVVMRKDCPLAAKKSVRPGDLANLPLICSRQALEHEIADWFGEKFDGLRIIATYDLFFNASIMVEERAGYMIALDNLVNTGSESVLTFRPLAPRLESGLCIAWKKHQVFVRAEELLLEEIKSKFSIASDDSDT